MAKNSSFLDRVREREAQREQNGEGDFLSRVNAVKSGRSSVNFGVDDAYIQNYLQDLESFLKSPSYNYETRYEDLTKRRSQIQNYLKSSSYKGDAEAAADFNKYLGEAQSATQALLGTQRAETSFKNSQKNMDDLRTQIATKKAQIQSIRDIDPSIDVSSTYMDIMSLQDKYKAEKEAVDDYKARNYVPSEAEINRSRQMQENKERTDAMSAEELRAEAERERAATPISSNAYQAMINERLANGDSNIAELQKKKDESKKWENGADRVLYYDQNGFGVTYDRLYREKLAENTWTNLTSDTEAYKLYEKIKEEEPTIMAQTQSGEDSQAINNDMAVLLADKDVLRQMGYDYDEIAYYQQYKADREGYAESIKDAENADPIKAALFTIASSPMQSLEYANNAIYSALSLTDDSTAYGLANIYDDKYRALSSTMLQGATQTIQDYLRDATGSELVAWLGANTYSGVVSSLQSRAQVAVCRLLFGAGVGDAISLALMASNAANQQFAESVKAGATNGEALATSIGAGINEALFEKISIENLDAIDDLIRSQRWDYANFSEFFRNIVQNSPSTLVQGLVEGSEEFFTDVANAIWDQYVNGANSEYHRTVRDFMNQGYDSTVAGKMATQQFFANLASSFYGGFIGGIGTGTMQVAGRTAELGIQNTFGARKLGKEISANNNVDVLLKQARELGDADVNTRADNLERAENPSNMQIGRLAQEVYSKEYRQIIEDHRDAFAGEVRNLLKESGVEDADKAAEIVAKEYLNQFLTTKERKIYAKVGGKEIIDSILNDPEIMKNIRSSAANVEHQQRLSETQSLVSTDIKESKSLQGSKSQIAMENAERKAKINAQSEQEAKESVARDYVKAMGYSPSTQDYILADVAEAGKNIKDISTFLYGVNEAITYGRIGYAKEYIPSDSYFGSLTEAQKEWAYGLGVDEGIHQLVEEQKKRNEKLGKLARRSGKVDVMESADLAVSELEKSNDPEDKKRLAMYKAARDELTFIVQEITHNNVHIFASQKGKDGEYYMPSDWVAGTGNLNAGDKASANGMYISGGDIYIDLNAGNNFEGIILRTAGHEYTHFIQEWSPEKYRTLAKFLLDRYGEAGTDTEEMLRKKIKNSKNPNTGEALSIDEAFDELVADAMEMMLTDKDVYAKLIELKSQDAKLFGKLKERVDQFADQVEELYKEINPQSAEARAVMNSTFKRLNELKDLFAEALVDAGETYGAANPNFVLDAKHRDLSAEKILSKGNVEVVVTEKAIEKPFKEYKSDIKTKAVSEGWYKKPLHNDDANIDLFVTPRTLEHTFSHLEKNGEETLLALSRLPEIAKTAKLIHISSPRNVSKLESEVYTFFGAMRKGESASNVLPVKLTVKAFKNLASVNTPRNIRDYFGRNNLSYSSIYDLNTLEVVSIEIKESGASAKVARLGDNGTPDSSKINIYDLLKSVNGDARKYIPQDLEDARERIRSSEEAKGKHSDRVSEGDDIINQSMSMDQCHDMIARVFASQGIKEWYDGEYKTADEWLEDRGVDEVAMYLENDAAIQEKYLNKIPAYLDGDIMAEEILDAYLNKTLTGSVKKATTQRLDITQSSGFKDARFYAPKDLEDASPTELYQVASQKVTKANKDVVNQARAKVLFLAHNKSASEFGISQTELNKKLRTWSNYSKQALDIQKRINADVPLENQWTGIENCSIINKQTVSDDDILSMINGIRGDSTSYKRQYIGRTMLALDTHIDWGKLTVDFKSGGFDGSATTRGMYKDNVISISNRGYAETVAHEMGHALDAIWGRDLFGEHKQDVFLSDTAYRRDLIYSEEAMQFYDNFRAFIDEISDFADIRSQYTQDYKEVFARFIAKFVEFTDATAGNHFFEDALGYHDRFNANHYYEFIKLLQEKAMLDSKRLAVKHSDREASVKEIEEQLSMNFALTGKMAKQSAQAIADLNSVKVSDATVKRSVKTLAIRFREDLINKGNVNLVGQIARSSDDLAVIAQVFRDPRFETLRYFFTDKDGKIVLQSALTSGVVDASSVAPKNGNTYLAKMFSNAKKLGAEKMYLLHNHPSGDPTPSSADHSALQKLSSLASHYGIENAEGIVIDSNKYSIFGESTHEVKPLEGMTDELLSGEGNKDLLGRIKSPDDLAALAKKIQVSDGYSAVIFLGAKLDVQAVQEIKNDLLSDEVELTEYVENGMNNFGATRVAFVTPKQKDYLNALSMYEIGLAVDVIKPAGDLRMTAAESDTRQLSKGRIQGYAEEVKYSTRDSEGRELTPAQQEYFKDSKVRDENGNLLVMHHGTYAEPFTVFRTSTESNLNNIGSHFGSLIAAEKFAEHPLFADRSRVYNVYLNITNPYETYDWFGQDDYYPAVFAKDLADEIGTKEAHDIIEEIKAIDESIKYVIENRDNLEEGYIDVNTTDEWNEKAIVLYGGIRKLLELGGYDGLKYVNDLEDDGEWDYIALYPEQVKNVDNLNPTNNVDIRYSTRSPEFDSKFDIMEDGRIKAKSLDALSMTDWGIIQKAVKKIGYTDIRSAKDAKDVFSRYIALNGFMDDQSQAIMQAYGVSEIKRNASNPARAKKAKKLFGTTTDFREAGYLLQDGTMLDFSGVKKGGRHGMRAMDHREIAPVFNEGEVDTSFGYGDSTPYMNAFIDEGNIRLMESQGVTIGEIEPTPAQYSMLKKFIDHVLRDEGYFYLDLSNARGNTIESRDYDESDSASKIISDIKAYFKNGELPYRSELQQFRYSSRSIDQDYIDFTQSVLAMADQKAAAKRQHKIGVVDDRHAEIVNHVLKTEFGIDMDVRGYEIWIGGNEVKHIERRHGINGKHDHTMADIRERSMAKYVVNNATMGEAVRKQNGNLEYDGQYRNKDNSPSPKVRLSMDLGSHMYYVVECVPDSASKRLHILTQYKQKNKVGRGQELTISGKPLPQLTPEANLVSSNLHVKDTTSDKKVKQDISSADTSLDQIPALFTDKRVQFGETNIDIGGGRYDKATNYLAEQGTTNYVFDPFNRSEAENQRALDVVRNGGADTATCANVLNVIAEKAARENVILEVAKSIKKGGTAYFMVYEGDGSGIGKATSKGYQNNRKTADYVDEISEYFDSVERRGKLIIATEPKANLPKASWELSSDNVVQYSRRNLGYHAGDLGKSTVDDFYGQGYSRGTGHFGFGTYFVGDPEKIGSGTGYGDRPVETVDFSKYNLFVPRDSSQAYKLHDALKKVDGLDRELWDLANMDWETKYYWEKDIKDAAQDAIRWEYSTDTELSQGRSKVDDFIEKNFDYHTKTELFDKAQRTFERNEEGDLQDAYYSWAADYIDDYFKHIDETYHRYKHLVDDLDIALRLRHSADQIRWALEQAVSIPETYEPYQRGTDSRATIFMKALGYEGVDVRHTDLDNVGYGSVIYDLKDEDLARKNEIGTAKWSLRDPRAMQEIEKINAHLEKENAKLKEDFKDVKELLKLQGKVTNGRLIQKKSVEQIAKRLAKEYNISGDRSELVDLLSDAYGYIQGSDNVSWDEVSDKIHAAVDWIRANEAEEKVTLSPEAKKLLSHIRNSKVSLSDAMKANAAHQYGSYNGYRKAMIGNIAISDNAPQTLDQLWQELASMNPEYFDPEVSEAEMPILLADAIANIRNAGSDEYYYGQSMMTDQDVFNEIYDGYWDVATLKTVADKDQAKINALKKAHNERMQKLRESKNDTIAMIKKEASEEKAKLKEDYRNRIEQQRQDLQKQYQERTERARERRTATDLRHRITKKIHELNKLLTHPDSKHHVPKDMQASVAAALDMLDLENPRQGEDTRKRLARLKEMYEEFQNTSNPDLQYAYDDLIAGMIDSVSKDIGDTPFQKMSVDQLEKVYQMYSAVMATIRNANKTFSWLKSQDITELSEDVMSEVKKTGGSKEFTAKWSDWVKKNFYWNNMKPIYAMRAIGSDTLTKLFENVRAGEDVYARDITEAKDRFETLAEKYGYNDWDLDERYEFQTADGRSFTLNIMEMMSLYEYYKRPQADAHLSQGGFVFEDNTIKKRNKLGILIEYKINNADTHRVTPHMMAKIAKTLTAEQKGFADEMQSYLAHEMGAKGNEVTEALYDIDIYSNDEHYFPLKSSGLYLYQKSEVAGDAKIKNAGFSKAVVPHANNPIVLKGLLDVWADHVNEMSMYHAFVLPLEDFQRVYNYSTPAAGEANVQGVKSAIRNAYGDAANSYIKTMLTDLNGGARTDSRADIGNKLIGLFKKGAVFASASVVIQQPSAVARAWAYIDPKYFTQTALNNLNLKEHSAQWEELKRYAPVAIIKEMGHFDTGLGASTQEWMKQTQPEGFMNKAKAMLSLSDSTYRDEILSKAPELADEITWTHIWQAAKKQVLAENPSLREGSTEHLEAAGKLFTDTIVNTQVYDSVLSRSGMMRSKEVYVKMATSFMAEPTTSINMIIDAFVQARRTGNNKEARRIIGSVLAQIILNSVLVSLVYAARDDDEDKTYAEKYIGQLVSNTLESVNPMTMIPYLKDFVSLLQGYDVERADMSVVADIIQAYRKMTSGELDAKKIGDFINQVAKIFGVPTQNITRDVRGIINVANGVMSGNRTSIEGIRESVLEEVTGKSPTQQYKSKLVKAIKSGDTAKIKDAVNNWVKQKVKTGKTEKEARSAIQSTLTSTYKPMFLKAYQKGDQAEMARIRKALNATGIYKDVVKTTQDWIKSLKDK